MSDPINGVFRLLTAGCNSGITETMSSTIPHSGTVFNFVQLMSPLFPGWMGGGGVRVLGFTLTGA